MKTTYQIEDATELANFEPIEGTWDSNEEGIDYPDLDQIKEEIAADLEAKHGFKVKVQLFQKGGKAICDGMAKDGEFLATRK